MKRSKTSTLNAADVSAASFNPQNGLLFSIKWINVSDLRTGIATAEVGYAEIGTK
jgi:hypothetical protein